MAEQAKLQKFTETEMQGLRVDLSKSMYDSWQAADIVSEFLSGRGYGACMQQIRGALLRIDGGSRNMLRMREELEKIAYVM